MPDILIRDVPADVVAAIDTSAQRQGLSRSEYLRRTLLHDARRTAGNVTVGDLDWFSKTFVDLDDPEIMARAWQ
ncbi:MAG: type II toxin-antitoxin system VapB family antitoxin [Pseudonocardiales bacterium]